MKTIPLCKALIESEELQAVEDVLKSGWLTHGPKTTEFEILFAESIGVKHAVAMNSCTSALYLALLAPIPDVSCHRILLPSLNVALPRRPTELPLDDYYHHLCEHRHVAGALPHHRSLAVTQTATDLQLEYLPPERARDHAHRRLFRLRSPRRAALCQAVPTYSSL